MRFAPSVPRFLREAISHELESNEHIRWLGMPKAVFFTPTTTGIFVFGLPWTAIAIMITSVSMKASHGLHPSTLLTLPFILVGVGMLLSPICTYAGSKRTAYVITHRRAITFQGGRTLTIRSYPPEKLQQIFRTERKDGSGDVIIQHTVWPDADGHRRSAKLGFFRIAGVREVERMLKELGRQATQHKEIGTWEITSQ
ncbi:MAG: hypothetical protein KTR25_00780 [Myxococcales bacterium]|nr:hypothetical protein [Myxococcales bacterium]